jgi:hypothetical protein
MSLAIKYKDENNPLPEIIEKLNNSNFNYENTYVAFYISPIAKFDEDKTRKKVYYRVKEELLKRRIISQVIDFDKLKSKINNYQFELNNISLALLAKLEGKPWQLSTSSNKDLIIGVGAFKNAHFKITITQFIPRLFIIGACRLLLEVGDFKCERKYRCYTAILNIMRINRIGINKKIKSLRNISKFEIDIGKLKHTNGVGWLFD